MTIPAFLFMQRRFLGHLVAIHILKHVLRRQLLALWQSLVWILLEGTEVGLLLQAHVAVDRGVYALVDILVERNSLLALVPTGRWHIKILVSIHGAILLRKVLCMWLDQFARLFTHLRVTILALSHNFLLVYEVLLLLIHHMIDLAAPTQLIALKVWIWNVPLMDAASRKTSFSTSGTFWCNLLGEVDAIWVEVLLAHVLSNTKLHLRIYCIAFWILWMFRSNIIHIC